MTATSAATDFEFDELMEPTSVPDEVMSLEDCSAVNAAISSNWWGISNSKKPPASVFRAG